MLQRQALAFVHRRLADAQFLSDVLLRTATAVELIEQPAFVHRQAVQGFFKCRQAAFVLFGFQHFRGGGGGHLGGRRLGPQGRAPFLPVAREQPRQHAALHEQAQRAPHHRLKDQLGLPRGHQRKGTHLRAPIGVGPLRWHPPRIGPAQRGIETPACLLRVVGRLAGGLVLRATGQQRWLIDQIPAEVGGGFHRSAPGAVGALRSQRRNTDMHQLKGIPTKGETCSAPSSSGDVPSCIGAARSKCQRVASTKSQRPNAPHSPPSQALVPMIRRINGQTTPHTVAQRHRELSNPCPCRVSPCLVPPCEPRITLCGVRRPAGSISSRPHARSTAPRLLVVHRVATVGPDRRAAAACRHLTDQAILIGEWHFVHVLGPGELDAISDFPLAPKARDRWTLGEAERQPQRAQARWCGAAIPMFTERPER